jgi:hypothetical protein
MPAVTSLPLSAFFLIKSAFSIFPALLRLLVRLIRPFSNALLLLRIFSKCYIEELAPLLLFQTVFSEF